MATFFVYCSGSIQKGLSDAGRLYWTDAERKEVAEGARPNDVAFLNPDDPLVEGQDTVGQFGRDMYQVMIATAVVVDGRERRGIGVGVEIAASAALGTPVLVVAPPETAYRRHRIEYREAVVENYVHPHIASLAYRVVDSFADAGVALAELPPKRRRRVPSWLREAIARYENEILPLDSRMRETSALRNSHTFPR